MPLRRFHHDRESLGSENVKDATLKAADIAPNELQAVENIEVINGTFAAAADSVGVKEPFMRIRLDPEDVKHLKAAYLDIAYVWAATADGKWEFYDLTGAVVVAESTLKTGGESSERERITLDIAKLVADRDYKVRCNITVAGGAGETASMYKATLKLVKKVS